MTAIQYRMYKLSQEDNTFGAFLIMIYKMLVSSYFQAITNIIFTIIIGIYSFKDGQTINKLFLLIVGIIYIIFNILFITVNNYRKQKTLLYSITSRCLEEMTSICYTFRESLTEAKKNNEKNPKFQSPAMICESIYRLLKDTYKDNNFKITIFQQFIKRNGTRSIKIIAYKSHENKCPKCSNKNIPLFDSTIKDEDKLYIVRLFESNNPDIICLERKELVESAFVKIEDNEIHTRQYLAVPCQVAGEYISFIIQVCPYDNDMFKTTEEMNQIGKNILLSYSEILALINEQESLYKISIGKVGAL